MDALSPARGTDILDARLIAFMASPSCTWHHERYGERPRPRAEISNVAMSTVLTKARRRVVASNGTVGRSRAVEVALVREEEEARVALHDHLV